MEATTIVWLTALVFVTAILYASVGHAGASGYLAAMALLAVAPGVMKPTALVLNIAVATIATFRFQRAGYFSWSTLWPFALGSIPFAFLGGAIRLPGHVYKPAVGCLLLLAAVQLAWATATSRSAPTRRAPRTAAIVSGAGIGLLSGLTGTGGGIFLSPLLLFMGWAEVRQAAGVAAAFILMNSFAGLAGNLLSVRSLPPFLPWLLGAAVAGGLLGAELGSRRLAPGSLRYVLAVVLVVAGLKLMLL